MLPDYGTHLIGQFSQPFPNTVPLLGSRTFHGTTEYRFPQMEPQFLWLGQEPTPVPARREGYAVRLVIWQRSYITWREQSRSSDHLPPTCSDG